MRIGIGFVSFESVSDGNLSSLQALLLIYIIVDSTNGHTNSFHSFDTILFSFFFKYLQMKHLQVYTYFVFVY